jgi:hypothetical protein
VKAKRDEDIDFSEVPELCAEFFANSVREEATPGLHS